jgi:hypothetical protein
MKKLTKNYEAPVAEVIEMEMPVVLTGSITGGGGGGVGGGGVTPPPIS